MTVMHTLCHSDDFNISACLLAISLHKAKAYSIGHVITITVITLQPP